MAKIDSKIAQWNGFNKMIVFVLSNKTILVSIIQTDWHFPNILHGIFWVVAGCQTNLATVYNSADTDSYKLLTQQGSLLQATLL